MSLRRTTSAARAARLLPRPRWHILGGRVRAAVAWLCAAAVATLGVAAIAVPAAAGPADGVLAITAERVFDGVAPLPSIDDDPALPLPPGYTAGVGENHNGEVATFDKVGYRFTVSYNLAAGSTSTGERVRNVTITATATPGARWRMLNNVAPAGCSSATGSGTNVLTCVVNGPLQTGDAFTIPAELYAPATFADGASIAVTGSVRAEYLNQPGNVPSGTFVGPVTDTAAPTTVRTATYAPNLRKDLLAPFGRSVVNRDPVTGAPTSADLFWPFYLEPDSRGGPGVNGVKGYGGLPGNRATFTDRLSTATPAGVLNNATLSGCGTRSASTGVAAPGSILMLANGSSASNTLSNNGTWACAQPAAGGDVAVTVTGADYAARWFPDGNNINDIRRLAANSERNLDTYGVPAGENTWTPVSNGYFATRVPWADLLAADAAETGANQNNGSLTVCNAAANDLTLSTVADPGTPLAVEPASRTSDNSSCVLVQWSGTTNDQTGYIGSYNPGGGTASVGVNALNGGPGANNNTANTTELDQDVVAGDYLYLQAVTERDVTSLTSTEGHVSCMAFDGELLELSPSLPAARPAIAGRFDGPYHSTYENGARPAWAPEANLSAEWVVEFASVAPWRSLPSRFTRVTNVDADGDGAVECDDPDVSWSADPSTLGGAPNLVRIRAATAAELGTASGAQVFPGVNVSWTIPVRVRTTAPDDAIGVLATRFKASNLAFGGSAAGLGSWDRPCTGEQGCTFAYDGYTTDAATGGLSYPQPTVSTNGLPSYSYFMLQAQRNASNWDRLRVVPARASVRVTDRGALPSDYPSTSLPEDVKSVPSGTRTRVSWRWICGVGRGHPRCGTSGSCHRSRRR